MLHSEMELAWTSAPIPAELSVDESSSQAEYVIRTNFAALYRELNEPIRTASSNLRIQQQQQQQQQLLRVSQSLMPLCSRHADHAGQIHPMAAMMQSDMINDSTRLQPGRFQLD